MKERKKSKGKKGKGKERRKEGKGVDGRRWPVVTGGGRSWPETAGIR